MRENSVDSILAIVFSFLASCILLISCDSTRVKSGGDIPAPGGDTLVTIQRLSGARLTDIRENLSWSFLESVVIIENKGQSIPSDLVVALLEDQSTCNRIEAAWQFDENSGLLRLSSMKVDGRKMNTEASISIKPAGHIRVNLGDRQYNVLPGEAKTP